MQHYYQDIQGWFSFSQLYSNVVQKFPEGSHFVEVGVWKGTSAAYMGVEIINSGKKLNLIVLILSFLLEMKCLSLK